MWASNLVDGITMVGNFLYLVAYLIILGDFGVQLLSFFLSNAQDHRMYVILVLGFIGCFPLSLLSHINSLRFTSIMAFVAILFFMCVVFGKSVESMSKVGVSSISYFTINTSIFRAIPLAIGAYSCHISVFPIVSEMKDKTKAVKVVSFAFIFAFIVFFIVGLFGYLNYGSATEGNLLKNYQGQGGIVIPVIIVMSFVIITTYPLVNFTCRVAQGNLIWRDHQVKTWRGYVLSTANFTIAVIISLFVNDLALILGIVGSLATSTMTLILPALIFYRISIKVKFAKTSKWELRACIVLIVFGVAIAILGLITTILGYVNK